MVFYPPAQGPCTHEHTGEQGSWNHVVRKEFLFLKMVHNSLETGEGSLKIGSATKGRLYHTKFSSDT